MRVKWTKCKKERLSGLWSDPSVSKEDILKEFPGIKWETLKSQASKMGLFWDRVGLNDIDLPYTNLDNPYKVKCSRNENPKIMVINSPFVGIDQQYGGEDSLLSNALRLAEADGCDAVFISGNLFYIDVVRYSKLKPFRARVSAINPDKESVSYPDSVEEEMGSLGERIERGDLIFLTFRLKLNHVIEMVKKAFYRGDSQIFSRPIYICFGNVEETLAAWLTNENIASLVEEENAIIKKKISQLKQELKSSKDEQEKQVLAQKIEDYEAYRRIFINMTNVAEIQVHGIYNQMRDYIIKRVEAAIPNAKFVGTGDTFLSVGGGRSKKIIKIIHKPNDNSRDTYLGAILQKTRKAINRGDRQPDVIVIGGTNLTYTSIPVSYQRKEGPTSVVVAQLPTAVDARSLKHRVSRGIKKGNPLFELTDTPDFKAGVITYEWVNGIPREKMYWSDFLTNDIIFSSADNIREVVEGNNTIYGELEGDEHHGHKFMAWYSSSRRPYIRYHSQIIHDFLKDAPICFYLNAGDIVQAHNHEYEEEMHPLWLPDFKLKQLIEEREKELDRLGISGEEKYKKMLVFIEKMLFKNTLFTGILMTGHQIESYVANRIIPHVDYFYGIVKRALEIGIDARGTLGIINYLSGNHFVRTHGGYFSESGLVSRRLIDELLKKHHDLDEKTLEALIKSPMMGTVAVSEGVLGINPEAGKFSLNEILLQDKYYYYAFAGKHKQGGGSTKYSDSMKPMRESAGKRGTTEPFFEGRFIVYWGGHTHYGGITTSLGSLFIRSGSQTFHDPFGEMCDFPLNNISTEIIGLPKNGPQTGPVVVIHLRYEEFKDYEVSPWEIDKDKLFANSIVKVVPGGKKTEEVR